MFLELVEGEIKVTAEGMELSSVKELYARDRHQGKPWFNACIKYIYYMYKKGGMFSNMLPEQRGTRICSEMLKDRNKMQDFELDIYCKRVITDYLNLQYTPNELLYESIKDDIQGLLNRLKNIPYVKTVMVEVMIDVPDHEGIMTKMPVKQKVEFDNSEEKAKAMKLAETLIDYESKLKAKIMAETKEQRKTAGKVRLFEKN